MPDVDVVVVRHAADVHADFIGRRGLNSSFSPVKRIMNFEHGTRGGGAPSPADMSLSRGASSGPCAWPVKRHSQRHEQLRALASRAFFQDFGQLFEVRVRLRRRHRVAAAKKSGPAAAMTLLLVLPKRRQLAAHHRAPGAASAGSTTLWRTSSMKSAESSGPSQAAICAADIRSSDLLLPVHQLGLVETRRRAAQMFRAEVRGHVGRGQPPVDVAGMSQTEQMIEHGGGEESALAKLLRAGAAVPLRQGRAVLPHQQPTWP